MNQQIAISNLLLDEDFQRLNNVLKKKTIFDILQIENKELPFTRLLAWLLDPHADHQMRTAPLRAFLRHCLRVSQDGGVQVNALPYESLNFAEVRLSSEFAISTTRVTVDGTEKTVNGRFDVYADYPCPKVEGGRCPLLVIEAKIEAGQSNNQTCLYQEWVDERCGHSPVQPVLVYLAPSKDRVGTIANKFVILDFNQINSWLETLRPVLKSAQADFVINELSVLNSRTNRAESSELDDLVQKIIQKNEESVATLKRGGRVDSSEVDEYEHALVYLGLLSARRGSLGFDEHIARVREAAWNLFKNNVQWQISGGEGSITLRYIPFQKAINQVIGAIGGINLDLWIDRSKNFLEIAVYSTKNNIPYGINDKLLRKSLVFSLRKLLKDSNINGMIVVDTDTFQIARVDLPRGTTTVASAIERLQSLEVFGNALEQWLETGFKEWQLENGLLKTL